MILVDTSVWVDLFRNRATVGSSILQRALQDGMDVCICGVILTELLQGVQNQHEQQLMRAMLDPLIYLKMKKDIFILSADIYRNLRKRGVTIRKTIDCLIGAVAIFYNVPLLHADRDFDPLVEYCGLSLPRKNVV